VGTAEEHSPSTDLPWYEAFLIVLILALLFIAPGAYCLRRGITQAYSSKPTQGKISRWWWLLPIFLGPIGGIIAWLKQRDVDWRKASNLLTLGIVLSVLWTIPFLAWKAPVQPTLYTLTINISPSGAGSVSPSGGEYESGEQVTLTASPASDYTFDYWGGSASGTTSTITITMDSDKSLTAHFEAISTVPEVLFSDDFSDESSGWVTSDGPYGRVIYRDGCLYVKDYTTDEVSSYGQSQRYFTDFILEVETWLVDGTDVNWHSVDFRVRDAANFYTCGISDNGYYTMVKFVDGKETIFVESTYSSYIHQAQGVTNLIHIECIGSNLSLSVNGHLLETVTDATFTGGDIALAAAAYSGTFTEVAFDNIIVTKP